MPTRRGPAGAPRARAGLLRALVWLATATGLLVLSVAGPIPRAAAHASLLSTTPADGEVLAVAPEVLTLTFDEAVRVPDDGVALLTAEGTPVAVSARAVDATVEVDVPDDLGDGGYVLTWRVVSADTHPVAGAFTFGVGAGSTLEGSVAAGAPEASGAVDALRWAAQGAVYLGTLGVAGLVALELLLLDAAPGAVPRTRRRLRRAAAAGGAVAGGGLAVLVPVTAAWQRGEGLEGLASAGTWAAAARSDTALAAALTAAGLVAALVAGPRAAAGTGRAALALGGAGLALGSLLVVGHTRSYGPPALILTADALHLAAGAMWWGGLVGLVLVLSPGGDTTPGGAAGTLARFSAAAAWVLGALAASGTALAWRTLGSLDALTGTGYGRVLLVKVALVGVVAGLAAWNRWRLLPGVRAGGHPRLRRVLGRTVAVESAVLAVAVALTGALVTQDPSGPDGAGAAERAAPASRSFEEPLGDGTLRARLTPGALGVNALELTVLDAAGRPLDPVADPRLEVSLPAAGVGPLTPPVSRTGTGAYDANVDLPLPGAWEVEVSVRTSTYEAPRATLLIEVPE